MNIEAANCSAAIFCSESRLPTRYGTFLVRVYRAEDGTEPVALVSGEVRGQTNVLVRVHSACLTSEIFGSLKCDCQAQLEMALGEVQAQGGVVVYLHQEGRGIGLANKIKAYQLQEQGYDTIEANRLLGLPVDGRDYRAAAAILCDLGIRSVRLMTNNPDKVAALESLGAEVTGRVPAVVSPNPHSASYLDTKRDYLGHFLPRPDFRNGHKTYGETGGRRVLERANGPSRPFVHLNFAVHAGGSMLNREPPSPPISCSIDWRRVHWLRELYTAIAVGARTWNLDKPRLSARVEHLGHPAERQPHRVVFAGSQQCALPVDDRISFLVGARRMALPGVKCIHAQGHDLRLPLRALFAHGVDSIMIEGGPTLLNSFLSQGFYDRITVYVASCDAQAADDSARRAVFHLPEPMEAESFGEGTLLNWCAPDAQRLFHVGPQPGSRPEVNCEVEP